MFYGVMLLLLASLGLGLVSGTLLYTSLGGQYAAPALAIALALVWFSWGLIKRKALLGLRWPARAILVLNLLVLAWLLIKLALAQLA